MNKSLICFLMLLVASSGCAVKNSMRLSDKISIWNPLDKPTEEQDLDDEDRKQPQTMAVIWKDALLEQANAESKRGFGGRIYFYDDDSNAVRADGELVIYAFDDESENPTEPDRRFVFKQNTLQQHYSESPLGGSYSVWLPWDDYSNSHDKSVTLVPIFVSKSGQKLTTSQSICALPGKYRRPEDLDNDDPFKFLGSSSALVGMTKNPRDRKPRAPDRTASGDQRSRDRVKPTGMQVTELTLTRNLQRRVGMSAENPQSQLGALSQVASSNQEPWQPTSPARRSNSSSDATASIPAAVTDQNVAPASAAMENRPTTQPQSASRPVFGAPGDIQ